MPQNLSQSPELSIVIPAYNEERRLPSSLKTLRAYLDQLGVSAEVIVSVEKSNDRTLEFSRAAVGNDPRFNIVDNQVHRGKGYAVRAGMLKATGSYVFFMDADLSTPVSEIAKFLAYFKSHPQTDIVIGSRADERSQILKSQSWFRKNLGRGFNGFVQALGTPGIKDTQCGFKAFTRKANKEIFSRQSLDGFAFDVEVLLLAQAMSYKIEILPVQWINSEDSKVRVLIDPIKMLVDLSRTKSLVKRTLRANPLKA